MVELILFSLDEDEGVTTEGKPSEFGRTITDVPGSPPLPEEVQP